MREAFPLMEFIDDELWARNWSFRYLCEQMAEGDPKETEIYKLAFELHRAVEDDPNVTLSTQMAEDMGRAFGVDPQFFINLHEAWRAHLREEGLAPPSSREADCAETVGSPKSSSVLK